MTPAEAKQTLRAFLAEYGEDVIVRRYTGAGESRAETVVTVRARIVGYTPAELIGAIAAGDRRVIMCIDGLEDLLPLSLDGNDVIEVRGKEQSLKAIDDNTRRINGELIGLELQVRGP